MSGRPAAGLYVVGWVLSGVGFLLLLVALGATSLRGMLFMASLLLLVLGLSAAAGYQVVERRSRIDARFDGPSPLIVFALQLALVNAASIVLFALGVDLAGSSLGFLIAAIVLFLGYVSTVWLFGFRTNALEATWLRIPRTLGGWLSDIAVGALTMVVVAFLAGLWGALIALLLGTKAPDVVPTPTTGYEAALLIAGACVLIPIGEELYFRGYALTAWWRDLGVRSALIRTTLFFAAIHMLNVNVDPGATGAALDGAKQAVLELLVIAPVGLALGWLFVRRGLLASIAGHAAFNLFGVLLLIVARGAV